MIKTNEIYYDIFIDENKIEEKVDKDKLSELLIQLAEDTLDKDVEIKIQQHAKK